MNERFVVLGVAPARRDWFRRVARWANEAAIPVEFVKCISSSEVISRLETGQPFSAVLADASTNGLDRDLIDLANSAGCTPIIIDHGLVERDWHTLGVRAVLDERFDAGDLLSALEDNAQRIGRGDAQIRTQVADDDTASPTGQVVAVTGAGGIGTSTIAMAAAQGMVRHEQLHKILLADMALRSSQAMFHDARDVVPGLLELVEAHRLGVPNPADTMSNIHTFPERGYDLLLGLRNERDWISVPARALSATWTSLTSMYTTTVCDLHGEFDGMTETGSSDIEDRNRLGRMAAMQADLIVVVGAPGSWGVHHLVRTVMALAQLGVDGGRILPVINHAPRKTRVRASITSAVGDLLSSRLPDADKIANPIFVPNKRQLEATLRDGDPLPSALTNVLGDAIAAMLLRTQSAPPTPHAEEDNLVPVAVVPGSLGTWSEDDE